MPHSFGSRARTRDMFSRPFRQRGMIKMSTYMTQYKLGDYVDIKCNAKVQKGMPHRFYHGRTGVIYNVTKGAVGVVVNKEVNGRIIKKRVNLRVEHVHHSKCRDELISRVKANEQILNPSYSFPNTILESKRMLRQVMSEEEALEVMTLNPAVLQCGPSLDLFGTDEIKMIAQMRSMGNTMVPAPLRPVLVALLVASIVLTVVAQGSDSQELLTLVDTLKPLLGGGIAVAYGGALYGAAQMGRKPSAS